VSNKRKCYYIIIIKLTILTILLCSDCDRENIPYQSSSVVSGTVIISSLTSLTQGDTLKLFDEDDTGDILNLTIALCTLCTKKIRLLKTVRRNENTYCVGDQSINSDQIIEMHRS